MLFIPLAVSLFSLSHFTVQIEALQRRHGPRIEQPRETGAATQPVLHVYRRFPVPAEESGTAGPVDDLPEALFRRDLSVTIASLSTTTTTSQSSTRRYRQPSAGPGKHFPQNRFLPNSTFNATLNDTTSGSRYCHFFRHRQHGGRCPDTPPTSERSPVPVAGFANNQETTTRPPTRSVPPPAYGFPNMPDPKNSTSGSGVRSVPPPIYGYPYIPDVTNTTSAGFPGITAVPSNGSGLVTSAITDNHGSQLAVIVGDAAVVAAAAVNITSAAAQAITRSALNQNVTTSTIRDPNNSDAILGVVAGAGGGLLAGAGAAAFAAFPKPIPSIPAPNIPDPFSDLFNDKPGNKPSEEKPEDRREDQNSQPTTSKPTTSSSSISTSSLSSSTSSSSSSSSSTSSSTTSSTSATATPCMIFPKDDRASDIPQLTTNLTRTFGALLTTIDDPEDPTGAGVFLWEVPLTAAQIVEFQNNPLISAVVVDSPLTVDLGVGINASHTNITHPDPVQNVPATNHQPVTNPKWRRWEQYQDARKRPLDTHGSSLERTLNRRASAYLDQKNAGDLALLSNGTKIDTVKSNTYHYDEAAGKGITVYVLDTGADKLSPEYANAPGNKRFLLVDSKGPPEGEVPWDDSSIEKETDYDGHGTAVVSKIVGLTHGAAKKADLVVVRFPLRTDKATRWSKGAIFRALRQVWVDIKKNNLQGKAVINISFGFSRKNTEELTTEESTLRTATQKLMKMGAVVVCASGNSAMEKNAAGQLRLEVDAYPSLFVEYKETKDIIVVGSANSDGTRSSTSQGVDPNILTISAQGFDVPVDPWVYGGRGSGTSLSTPVVSGLVAYFLSLDIYQQWVIGKDVGQTAAYMKALVQHFGWARVPGGQPMAYNGAAEAEQEILCVLENVGKPLSKRADVCGGTSTLQGANTTLPNSSTTNSTQPSLNGTIANSNITAIPIIRGGIEPGPQYPAQNMTTTLPLPGTQTITTSTRTQTSTSSARRPTISVGSDGHHCNAQGAIQMDDGGVLYVPGQGQGQNTPLKCPDGAAGGGGGGGGGAPVAVAGDPSVASA